MLSLYSVSFSTDLSIAAGPPTTIIKERHIINIVTGAMELLSHELANYEVEGTDHLIKIITKNVSLLNSKEIDYLYQKGYSIGKESIKNIKFKHTNKKA